MTWGRARIVFISQDRASARHWASSALCCSPRSLEGVAICAYHVSMRLCFEHTTQPPGEGVVWPEYAP